MTSSAFRGPQRTRRTRAWRRALVGEGGYTLAEVAVAMALLVTVLVPTALSVVALTRSPAVRHRAEALARARAEVEAALAVPVRELAAREVEDGPWRVVRSVDRDGAYVGVAVEVYRPGRRVPGRDSVRALDSVEGRNGRPLAALETGRFVAPEPEPLPGEPVGDGPW